MHRIPLAFLRWLTLAVALIATMSVRVQAVGLVSRPANPDCLAPDRPSSGLSVPVNLEVFFGNANGGPFDSYPVVVAQSPADSLIWYVVEGRVLRVDTTLPAFVTTTALDYRSIVEILCSGCEGGMLGMALHPDFAANGEAFIHYTATGSPYTSKISRFTSSDGGLTLDPLSEEVLMTLDQTTYNHQGGSMAFGPDGYLYLGLGDGGVGSRAADTSNLWGTIARIDVDGALPYAIPPDNPFAQGGGAPEIYAYGFRNPWRFSFDSLTGDLPGG